MHLSSSIPRPQTEPAPAAEPDFRFTVPLAAPRAPHDRIEPAWQGITPGWLPSQPSSALG